MPKDVKINIFSLMLMNLIEKTRTAQWDITANLKKMAARVGNHEAARLYQNIDDKVGKYRKTGGFRRITEPTSNWIDGTFLSLAADMRKVLPIVPSPPPHSSPFPSYNKQYSKMHIPSVYLYSRILQEVLTELRNNPKPMEGIGTMLGETSPAYLQFISSQTSKGVA